MIESILLSRLRCLRCHTSLHEPSPDLLKRINDAIEQRQLRDSLGRLVTQKANNGLVDRDEKCFYPVHNESLQMIREEVVDIEPLRQT